MMHEKNLGVLRRASKSYLSVWANAASCEEKGTEQPDQIASHNEEVNWLAERPLNKN